MKRDSPGGVFLRVLQQWRTRWDPIIVSTGRKQDQNSQVLYRPLIQHTDINVPRVWSLNLTWRCWAKEEEDQQTQRPSSSSSLSEREGQPEQTSSSEREKEVWQSEWRRLAPTDCIYTLEDTDSADLRSDWTSSAFKHHQCFLSSREGRLKVFLSAGWMMTSLHVVQIFTKRFHPNFMLQRTF